MPGNPCIEARFDRLERDNFSLKACALNLMGEVLRPSLRKCAVIRKMLAKLPT